MLVNNIIISYLEFRFYRRAVKEVFVELVIWGCTGMELYCLFSKSGLSEHLHDAAEDEDILVHSISCSTIIVISNYCD